MSYALLKTKRLPKDMRDFDAPISGRRTHAIGHPQEVCVMFEDEMHILAESRNNVLWVRVPDFRMQVPEVAGVMVERQGRLVFILSS